MVKQVKNAFNGIPMKSSNGEKYEIQNWPEVLECLDRWNKHDIGKIRENIKFSVCEERLSCFSILAGIKQLGNLTDILEPSWTKQEVQEFYTKKVSERNRLYNSELFGDYLDRRIFPESIITIEINNLSMNSQKNTEIPRDYK